MRNEADPLALFIPKDDTITQTKEEEQDDQNTFHP